MKQARKHNSVQRDMVYLRETKGDMLCLYAPGSPTKRSYRAVLEVSPINWRVAASPLIGCTMTNWPDSFTAA
jgi:hypothetical protein